MFSSKEQHIAFILRWKELAKEKKLTREDILLRCILLKKDVLKALPPTKNVTRLRNGAGEDSGLYHAVEVLKHADPVRAKVNRDTRLKRWETRGLAVPSWESTDPSWVEAWSSALESEDSSGIISHELLQAVKEVVKTIVA